MKPDGMRRRMILTRRGKAITTIAMVWLFVNFAIMVGISLSNGTSLFPNGSIDAHGYHAIDHGKRHDLAPATFHFGYWQGAVTWVSFPVVILIIIPILYGTGDIREAK